MTRFKKTYIKRWAVVLVCYILGIIMHKLEIDGLAQVLICFCVSATVYGLEYTIDNWQRLTEKGNKE